MEDKPRLTASQMRELTEMKLPVGEGPVPHTVRFYDPREVEAHFAVLKTDPPSAEERWARKANALPFPGV
jgi:hypothetical protein